MAFKVDKEQVKRWRLILGQHAQDSLAQMVGAGGCELSPEQMAMDEALAALDAVNNDYPTHTQAAREIAAEYFSAEKVLRKLLHDAGL